MAQLRRLLCFFLLICSVLGAPIASIAGSIPDSHFREGHAPPEQNTPSQSVSLSSFGHLAVNVGIGGALLLGAIAVAEGALHLFGVYRKTTTEREQLELQRAGEQARRGEQLQREYEALEILLDLADKQARTMSLEGPGQKWKPLVVPKEIHHALEGIFRKKNGEENAVAFRTLKESLTPLLEFEE